MYAISDIKSITVINAFLCFSRSEAFYKILTFLFNKKNWIYFDQIILVSSCRQLFTCSDMNLNMQIVCIKSFLRGIEWHSTEKKDLFFIIFSISIMGLLFHFKANFVSYSVTQTM